MADFESLVAAIGRLESLIRTNREEMLAKMQPNKERTEAKMEINQVNVNTTQEKMSSKIDANNEKFEVLRGTLVSRMDIHQARTESIQDEMKAKMDIHQKKMEAAKHFTRSELEETIKLRVEDVLSCVDQKTQGLLRELTEKIHETQVDLQAVKKSLDTRTKSLQETLADTKIFQEEARKMKAVHRSNKKGWKPSLRPPDASSRHS
jgi:hypothetical protein